MSEPSAPRKALNFAKAVIRHAVTGFRKLTDEEHAARLAICKGTDTTEPCSEFEKVGQKCRHRDCGCYLDSKARWADQNCPLSRWPPIDNP